MESELKLKPLLKLHFSLNILMFQFAYYNKFVFKFAKLCMIQLLLIHKGCPGSIPNGCYIQGLSLTMFYHMGCYHGHEVLAASGALLLLTALIMLTNLSRFISKV